MNQDKIYVYDERPGFEAYNSVNMQYPTPMIPNFPSQMNMGMNMPGFPVNNQNNQNSYNQLENRVSSLETKVQNLETKIKNLENSIYPKAVDYTQMSSDYINTSYQNSMNIM